MFLGRLWMEYPNTDIKSDNYGELMSNIISFDEFVKFSKNEQRDYLFNYLREKLTDEQIKFYNETNEIRLEAPVYEKSLCRVYGQFFLNVNKYDFEIPGEDILLRCFTLDSLDMSAKEQAKKYVDSWNDLHEDMKLVYFEKMHTYNAMQLFSIESITKNELSYNDFMQNYVSRMIKEPLLNAGKALEKMCLEHYLLPYDELLQKRDRYGIMEYFEIKGNKFLKKYNQETDELEIKMSFHNDKVSHLIFIYLSNGYVKFQIRYNDTQVFEKTIPEDEESAEVIEEIANSL